MNPRADIGPKPRPTPRPQPAPNPSGPRPKPNFGDFPTDADLPDLGDLLDAADHLGAQLIGLLTRGYDPETGPDQDGAVLPFHVDMRLRCAAAEVRQALALLAQIGDLLPPPASQPSGTDLRDIPARHHQRPPTQAVRPRREGVESGPAGGREAEAGPNPEGRRGASVGRPEEGPQVATSLGWGEGLQPGLAVAVPAARESDRGLTGPRSQANTNPPPPAGERADMPSRIAGALAAVVEAPGSTAVVPGAGVQPRRLPRRVRPVGPYAWPGTAQIAARAATELGWSR